ncbi:Uncharacterised protein [Moraxella lacunata]|uniref:Uncharacterized protein n=1 Tax=Moraxella lacunata TaxID=477 RepID=A0A378QD41_MORLA|nr:hypothetical protein [Moraxella lacunata]STY98816.1 Uncharacterised protein [Moraxella lacunata]
MSESNQSQDWKEFQELSDKRIYVESETSNSTQEPYQSELFNQSTVKSMPLYLVIGAVVGLVIGIFFKTLAKRLTQRKSKQKPLKIIRPEFREATKQEREHRQRQRRKYGIFDEKGERKRK